MAAASVASALCCTFPRSRILPSLSNLSKPCLPCVSLNRKPRSSIHVALATAQTAVSVKSSMIDQEIEYAHDMPYKGFNVQVMVEEDEPEEELIRRFRREVFRAGIIQECKRRRFFENKQAKKKRKAREAGKRNRRRRQARFPPKPYEDKSVTKRALDDDEEDNWDLPEGDSLTV